MRSLWIPSVAALALGTLVACGGGGEQTSDRHSRPAGSGQAAGGAAPASTGGYSVAAVSGGGSIAGKVSWQGQAPAAEKLEITKDTSVCGTEKTFQKVHVGDGGGLAGAIVWIDGISSGKDWGAIDGGTVDQHQCEYTPQIQIVRSGNELKIVNSDQILHNIHAYQNDTETVFNFAQPMQGMTTPRQMEKTGPVHLKCDVHSWMSAYVFVAGHPYYAVTGADGSFSLGDVPAGAYKVKAWHPVGGEKTMDVTVAGAAAASAEFSMP